MIILFCKKKKKKRPAGIAGTVSNCHSSPAKEALQFGSELSCNHCSPITVQVLPKQSSAAVPETLSRPGWRQDTAQPPPGCFLHVQSRQGHNRSRNGTMRMYLPQEAGNSAVWPQRDSPPCGNSRQAVQSGSSADP